LIALSILGSVVCGLGAAETVTIPRISERQIAIHELKLSGSAYAAIRKPPGAGPFPAIVFMHGGLAQARMATLRSLALQLPITARFLSWGYVTVNATRRAISHDPQERRVIDDTLAIVNAVRNLEYVDAESIVLFGASGGGTLALEVASVTSELAAIVASEPATIIYMGMFTKEHITVDPEGRPTADLEFFWKASTDAKALYTPEVRDRTRRKLLALVTPTLIVHGDQHWITNFNLDVFIPEMEAMSKPLTVIRYPGEPHVFDWHPRKAAEKANREADTFLRKYIRVQPKPVDKSWVQWVAAASPGVGPDGDVAYNK
jgi:acetyl esterase/lipase